MKFLSNKSIVLSVFLLTSAALFAQSSENSVKFVAHNDSVDKNMDSIHNAIKLNYLSSNFDFEMDFDDDNISAQQSISGLLSSDVDVYYNQTSFSFSPMRFRIRGYENEYHKTYINGVYFNGLERGNFNFSSLGGLNNATRNKEITRSMEPTAYTFGNIGSSTNINVKASNYARGSNLSASLTNRNYIARLQYTYASGLQPKDWAYMVSFVGRWANEGAVQGTSYKSLGYFVSLEKRFNNKHILNFSAFGAPTERGQQSAFTKEVYDLINGDFARSENGNFAQPTENSPFAKMFRWNKKGRYYNTNWGWQNGAKRNSRMVKSYDPTFILNYEWKISDKQNLDAGFAFHYSKYSNSAINFNNAIDPRPDYYRFLPSFLLDGHHNLDEDGQPYISTEYVNWKSYNEMVDMWSNRETNTQINWKNLYYANYGNETAKYIVERRHNDLVEGAFNLNYRNSFFDNKLKFTIGTEAKQSKGIHYKTIDDMLGAKEWIDKDPFAERDLTGGTLPTNEKYIILNNIGKDSVVALNQRFGYDYDINITHISAFVQNEWTFRKLELYYSLKGTYTEFFRHGKMLNGRAVALTEKLGYPVISKGKGFSRYFIDPAFKVGATYKIDGRNYLSINAMMLSQAPLAYNAYVSPRIKDTQVKNLLSEKVLSYDIGYNFSYPRVRGRIAVYQTHIKDALRLNGYYDDEYRTFINVAMSNINKLYRGVEFGVSFKLSSQFTLIAAGTFADYTYRSNANLTMSAENGSDIRRDGSYLDLEDVAMIKGLKTASGPQVATNLSLKYFHPKMWFAEVTINYFDNNYLDFAPSRFSTVNYGNGKQDDPNQWGRYGKDIPVYNQDGSIFRYKQSAAREALGTQEKLKGGFLLDLSIGKLIYLQNRQSLSINLSINNILNSELISGGYQQGRIPTVLNSAGATEISNNYNKYPNKYYFIYGTNFFFNISYKF